MTRSAPQSGRFSQPLPLPGMVWIEGGQFRMGSDDHYPEEGPARLVRVDGFWMDATPVTNAAFARFVGETGYITIAERMPDPTLYPGADLGMLQPGSLLFRAPDRRQDMRFWGDWWHYVAGACWHRPDGVHPLTDDLADHPVVHVAHADAQAFAAWAGKALPSEAEWEYAARGGLDAAEFAWGHILEPEGRSMANIWNGQFPMKRDGAEPAFGSTRVASYPPNGFGLFDLIGNVWEWTDDFWSDRHPDAIAQPCCIPRNPRHTEAEQSYDAAQPAIRIPRKVLKGGSYLCAPNYCRRYRPAARHPEMIDSATAHVGFRCVSPGAA